MDLGTALLVGIVIIAVSTATSVGVVLGSPGWRSWVTRLSKAVAKEQAGSAAELEALKSRVAELEERLDFAERVLSQSEQPARLPGRHDP
jgi:Tfp pilus assembly protein PilO